MSNLLKLYVPNFYELEYRRKLISDEKTMEYNIGHGENGTGCYYRTLEEVKTWYKNWNNDSNKFYAYLVRVFDNKPVGEVAIYYNDEHKKHVVSIIIEDCYRSRGYAKEGLVLLIKYAFQEMKLNFIIDEIPISRSNANNLFKKAGFIRINDDIVEMTKERFIDIYYTK